MEQVKAPFTELVISDLQKVEACMRDISSEVDPNLRLAIDQLLASGGKRLRPTLTLLSGAMLNANRQKTITLAAAIEMLHTATLVHDDLIDEALLRRGTPTLNAKWSAGATVLTGDYVFARAAHLAAETGSLELMKIFAEVLMVMVNGEITQLFGSTSGDIRKDYFNRIFEKTASLFEVSTYGPALLSGCNETLCQEMKSLGYEIGIAFQIIDDIFDFTGDQEKVGKPVGSDLRMGLITLPTIRYFESHPEDRSKEILLNGKLLIGDEMEDLVQRIRTSDAIDESFEEARQFIYSARERLLKMSPSEMRDALVDFADYIVQRAF